MSTTATTTTTSRCGCGGSASTGTGGYTRPDFFAGQLLTEDDLRALTGYLTGKNRLHNRMLAGPGVVCGLEVTCDPCGGGRVAVAPGYALDSRGNDLVVTCAERVDVPALLHDLRIAGSGVDCGDDCDDANRRYGLYLRYTEVPAEPVAAYPSEDGPAIGSSPTRIRETYAFTLDHAATADHAYRPATALDARLGEATEAAAVRASDAHLARYHAPLIATVRAAGTAVPFDQAADDALTSGLTDLRDALGEGRDTIPAADVPRVTELTRNLAAAVARWEVAERPSGPADRAGQARELLGAALNRLDGTATPEIWGDPSRRALAAAVLDETRARLLGESDGAAPLELRMLAQGAPLPYALRVTLQAHLNRLRHWLLARYDTVAGRTACTVDDTVTGLALPAPLPAEPAGDRLHPSATELSTTSEALRVLDGALTAFLAESACAVLHPPVPNGAADDVLLAVLTVDGCEVREICTAGREQVRPGGSAYAAWLPLLPRATELAATVCCPPPPGPAGQPAEPLPHLPNLFDVPPGGDLDELLTLITSTAARQPTRIRARETTAPEVAELREQVAALTGTLTALRDEIAALSPSPQEEPPPPATTTPAKRTPAKRSTASRRDDSGEQKGGKTT
ncbi:hypothetical protein [Actinoplanes sp. NPDC051851]|uniref:hypothetical protein n=1 Tax=Actinoplanes sp. NPDC051851 TaxID=3154753 RepID=UPI003425C5AB